MTKTPYFSGIDPTTLYISQFNDCDGSHKGLLAPLPQSRDRAGKLE
jgi:hypothetical protein